jgi:hypothetical protein
VTETPGPISDDGTMPLRCVEEVIAHVARNFTGWIKLNVRQGRIVGISVEPHDQYGRRD